MAQPAGPGPVALWRQLQAAAAVLESVLAGRSATDALAAVDASLRPAAQALSFHAMRELGRAQALRATLARRAPPPAADALLLTALALAWDAQRAPYEPFTLVDQAVEAAKRHAGMRAQSGFINACLRRFLRERDALVRATDSDPVARWNHPRWWIERLKADHPRHWQTVLQASQQPAPMTLRINPAQGSVAQYLQRLADAGVPAHAAGAHGVVLDKARPVHELPGFADGAASVQDAAAQLAAPLLLRGLREDLRDAAPGHATHTPDALDTPDAPKAWRPLRILDACAAPGGKTAHLIEWLRASAEPGAQVLALDADAARCARIHDTLQRLKLAPDARPPAQGQGLPQVTAEVRVADAGDVAAWWDGQPFDAILLDAPCTASGIVRRHPDVRWLRRETDIAQLAATQARLLQALWPLVRPGGRLLYCTCSVFRDEGERQLQAFVAHNTDARLLPSPGHLLPGVTENGAALPDNPSGDHDGFFHALLHKQAGAA